ncbi:MAG: hypothetical protein FWG73_05735 [Planctomycetaceae bacterium]|nr:hypothetical protein [Planctomycetaceae bacterium]
MKYLLTKIGLAGIALGALFALAGALANDLTEFEAMLQEKMRQESQRTSQNNSGNEPKTAATASRTANAPAARETQPSPTPGGRARVAPSTPDTANAQGTGPAVISDGWTTVKPNAPGTVLPEPRIVPPPAAKPSLEKPAAERPALETPVVEQFPIEFFVESDGHGTQPQPKEEEVQPEPELPVELFEPELINGGRTPAAAPPAKDADSLFLDSIFDEEYTVIEEPDDGGIADIGVLEIISEPRRRFESRTPISVTPSQESELSRTLEDLANEPIVEGRIVDDATDQTDIVQDTAPEKTRVVIQIPDFDREDEENDWKLIDPTLAGDPNAQDKLKLMHDEIINGLRSRNIQNRYEMWKNFARGIMRDTAGINTKSELDGRFRLKWFLKLYDEPVRSTFEVEEYSRELFVGFAGGHRHLAELMPGIRERMDIPKREDGGIKFPLCTTPIEALAEVKRALLLASSAHARAFSTLTATELDELEKNFVETFVGKACITGHTIPARSVGRRHVDILTRVDTAALYDGAEALIPLTNTALLDLLAQLPDDVLPRVTMNGQQFQRLTTAAGDILIGGHGRNTYDLDLPEMRDVICVISRGEDDTFREGTCNLRRPVMVIIALGKKNTFIGTRPGIQGGSVMGISMLLDRAERSTYDARDVAQGSSMGGVGILINYEGTNTYKGLRRVQGHALAGLGLLIDRGQGNSSYKASMWAQGFGAPGGFGALSNSGNGNNHFYCGGMYLDSYPEHPGYDGWGQGIGAGIRQVANGGIGVILSGAGNDVYEVDYFGHGGGYWLGVGIARDFGGNDMRHGTTLTDYNGRPRPGPGTQARWTRFVNGFGCHYALGYCFDDGGDDLYGGQIMGTGMAWDLAYGILADFRGSGRYTSTGNMKHGVGAEASIGILFSYGGNDLFAGRSQGSASPRHDYHPAASGGNFSFLINYGGTNQYGTGNQRVAQPHSYVQRGAIGGFLIDRPTESEAVLARASLRDAIDKRNQEIAEYDAMVEQMRATAAERRQRYVPPRQRRPLPISESQLISAVPDFDPNFKRADAADANVR